jgi:hypothetical protein
MYLLRDTVHWPIGPPIKPCFWQWPRYRLLAIPANPPSGHANQPTVNDMSCHCPQSNTGSQWLETRGPFRRCRGERVREWFRLGTLSGGGPQRAGTHARLLLTFMALPVTNATAKGGGSVVVVSADEEENGDGVVGIMDDDNACTS